MTGKKQKMTPMWKKLKKMWILTNPHHFLTTCNWDALNGNANRTKQSLNSTRRRLSYVFLLEQQKNYWGGRHLTHKRLRGPATWEGHAQKCVERYCELVKKKIEQLYKVSRLCLDDHLFKQEELESVGELSEVCSQIVLKCLYVARIGLLDILWSVNKLARSVTKWIQACDKRLARLISYIHQTSDYRQYCEYSQLHMSVRHDHEHERTKRKTSRLQPTHTTRIGALPKSPPWTWHTGGSRQRHPRYTSASTEEGRGWPDKLHDTTTDKRQHDQDKSQDKRAFSETRC